MCLLSQLSQRMMSQGEGQELGQVQAIHRRLLGQLTQVLSSPHSSSREAAVAVAGIGQLAAPTKRFFGQQVDFDFASALLCSVGMAATTSWLSSPDALLSPYVLNQVLAASVAIPHPAVTAISYAQQLRPSFACLLKPLGSTGPLTVTIKASSNTPCP